MSTTGSGYDYSCGTYSPDGRIFQVEYAQKAVESSGTAIGIKCTDGVVLATGKPLASPMLVSASNRCVFGIDKHAGMVVTGYAADGRQLVNRAREEAQSYKNFYGHPVVPSILSNRLALYAHYFTLYGSLRPFGCAGIIGAYDADLKVAELYMVEPSGAVFRYFGCAAGKGANNARTELEKLLNKAGEAGLTCREAVKELAKILQVIRDPSKDKPIELEMGWVCEESGFKHSHVPEELVKEAEAAALKAVEATPSAEGVSEEKTMDVEI